MKYERTEYFTDFVLYYDKAKILQNVANLGGEPYEGLVDDDLMEQVHIYDCVERQHAGFQNMLQDLWCGQWAPKFFKLSEEQKDRNRSYNDLQDRWSIREWLWVFLFHRITGSGASFEDDHGYRNTALPEIAKLDTCEQMADFIAGYDKAMFTSIGNQIPMFPKRELWPSLNKSGREYETPGKLWICECMTQLIDDTIEWMESHILRVGIRDVTDFMCEWNRERGMKRFHFQFTAFAADLADYFPFRVDPNSKMYYGKNAIEALELLGTRNKGTKKAEFYDLVMDDLVASTQAAPRDLEDVLCDYIRYIENYVPDNKNKTYAHLNLDEVWNNSTVRHDKGRQKWLTTTT